MTLHDLPNLLIVTADQLRPDCLGFGGRQPVSTPALDALAETGVVFAHAYTHIPTCCPARQSLLHGGRPESFGAYWNYDIGLPVATIDPTLPTWVSSMTTKGLDSCYVGKWHVHPTATPLDFGYQAYVPLEVYDKFRAGLDVPAVSAAPWFGAVDNVPTAWSRTHWMADKAVEWLDGVPTQQPWHLRIDFVEPHLPSCPTEEFFAPYRSRRFEPWLNWDDPLHNKPYAHRQQRWSWGVEGWAWADWSPVLAHYLAVISQLDAAIGRIVDVVEARADASSTVVVFVSDHGDMTGSHGMIDKHNVMYDEVLAVPLIVRCAERWAAAVRNQLVYGFGDLAATLYALYDDEEPERCFGRSLLGLLDGDGHDWRDEIVATYNGQQFGLYTQRAIRTDQWKYVWNGADLDELYDLASDPAELNNLIDDESHADVLVDLRHRLHRRLTIDGDGQIDNEWVGRQLLDGRKPAVTSR